MNVPESCPQSADPRAFLEGIRTHIQGRLEEEVFKFQLPLKVQLSRATPDGTEEYTDPVLRHKQETILQNSEISIALDQAIPEDVYKDMTEHANLYDTSNYPQDHPLHSAANKKILGKMKDECDGRPIAEYVGLRPKMYSRLEASGSNIKKAKGVKKSTVKKPIRHEQYKEVLFGKETFHHGMDVLHSERHRIYGQHLNKVSLSPFDSKRWIAENGVHTLAYGYKEAHPTCFNV